MEGTVYILSNISMPGIIKIGYTTRSVSQRISELDHTGHPTKFVSELEIITSSPEILERSLHNALSNYHYQKEFFKCDLKTAIKVIKEHLELTSITVLDISGPSKNLYISVYEKQLIEQNQSRIAAEEEERKRKAIEEEKSRLHKSQMINEEIELNWKEFCLKANNFRSVIKISIPIYESALNSTPANVTKLMFLPVYVIGGLLKESVLPSPTDFERGIARRKILGQKGLLGAVDSFAQHRKLLKDKDPEIYDRLYWKYRSIHGEMPDINDAYALGLMGKNKFD